MGKELVPVEVIENRIFVIRGHKVMLDSDLAKLYRVPTFRLNEQVKRNLDRFPEDFMFRLSKEEYSNLISQNAISRWGGVRKLPRVFTEQGVAMLSSVLRSKRAVHVNIQIMRAFVKLRRILSSHAELRRKIEEMERKYDANFKVVFDAIRKLMEGPVSKSSKKIGFVK
ncbi:ORF6N domain-containing protein [Candidatus Margulisiibacteriota bacterium]